MCFSPHVEDTTGLSLKVARTEQRVKAREIAEAMGVSPSRVASIEREGFVSQETAGRYLTALAHVRMRRTQVASA